VIGLEERAAVIKAAGFKCCEHLLQGLRWHVGIEAAEHGEHRRTNLVQTLESVGAISTQNPVLQPRWIAANSGSDAPVQRRAQGQMTAQAKAKAQQLLAINAGLLAKPIEHGAGIGVISRHSCGLGIGITA